ncbi:MAG: cobalamin biosynthesis protein [Thermaerobacter sp.]|jgi:cobalt-precorrin 5A hydrolase|nr:cobalamin biosynthesis protein [Thermaerobacter sp.]
MTTAVLALNRRGAVVAGKLGEALPADVLLPRRLDPAGFGSLAEAVGQAFSRYRGLVMVMAAGIVVRTVAPLLRDKFQDPAVVQVDEDGRFAVSLLCGHLGGANDLARRVAAVLGAQAVISTASELAGVPSLDLLARDFGLVPEPREALAEVGSRLVDQEPVGFYGDRVPPGFPWAVQPLAEFPGRGPAVVLTDRLLSAPGCLFLRPQRLTLGVGCRRGTSGETILAACRAALAAGARSALSLKALATVDRRRDETGLRQAATAMERPLLAYTLDQLALAPCPDPSAFVRQRLGIDGVCEPAALLAAGEGSRLVVPKRAGGGVAVALAEVG